MRKIYVLFCLAAVMGFIACSTDVDLYADYKVCPIIYGLLDANADTNFIKITRAFYAQGDAYQVAVNPDSSNYPGKLDARLVEYCNGDSIREIILDTITIHDKTEGTFYAPSQKLYYTAELLPKNVSSRKYSYKLKVVLPDRILTAKANLVGNSNFDVQSLAVNFSKEYFGAVPRRFLFRPAINGAIYQISLAFTFLEQRTPDGDSVPRTMTWDIGTYTDDYFSTHTDEGSLVFLYRPETFYEMLTDFIGGDTTDYLVKRYIGDYPVEVTITAGGDKLKYYVYTNDTGNGFLAGGNEFSLIDGGYGVFSSRMTTKRRVRLGGETVPELVARPHWGFKFIGGE